MCQEALLGVVTHVTRSSVFLSVVVLIFIKMDQNEKSFAVQPQNLDSTVTPPDAVEPLLVIDGVAQVDDMLMAACFANYENAALERIRQASAPISTFSASLHYDHKDIEEHRSLEQLLTKHGLQTLTEEDDSDDQEIEGEKAIQSKVEEESSNKVVHHKDRETNNEQETLDNQIATDQIQKTSNGILFHSTQENNTCHLKGLDDTVQTTQHVPPVKQEHFSCDDAAPPSEYDSNTDDETHSKAVDQCKEKRFWSFQPVVLSNLPSMVSESVQLLHIGHVRSSVGSTLVVESLPGKKALDLGSVLCLGSRDVLGTVSDTFGPVNCPYYVVCDSQKEVTEGEDVYVDGNNHSFIMDNDHCMPDYLKEAFEHNSPEQGTTFSDSDHDGDHRPAVSKNSIHLPKANHRRPMRNKGRALSCKTFSPKKNLGSSLFDSQIHTSAAVLPYAPSSYGVIPPHGLPFHDTIPPTPTPSRGSQPFCSPPEWRHSRNAPGYAYAPPPWRDTSFEVPPMDVPGYHPMYSHDSTSYAPWGPPIPPPSTVRTQSQHLPHGVEPASYHQDVSPSKSDERPWITAKHQYPWSSHYPSHYRT